MNRTVLNRTAAEIAAAALFETFPGIELLGGKKTSVGFSFDFFCKTPLPAELEILIEERMRQIVREKRPIRVLEMVPLSARALLVKEGHLLRAEEIEEGGLVEVIRIGTFHNLSPGPHLASTGEVSAFKLWPVQRVGENQFRLSGCAYPSKEELKQFLKRLRDYPELSHERLGLNKALWKIIEGQFFWLPKGLRVRQETVEAVRSHLFDGAIEISCPGWADRGPLHAGLLAGMGCPQIAEIYFEEGPVWSDEDGLFDPEGGMRARVSFASSVSDTKEKVISSLHLARKTLNILGFQHRICLVGRKRSGRSAQALWEAAQTLEDVEKMPEEPGSFRLEFAVEDQLGRIWPAFVVEAAAKGLWITASVERLVALLLEKKTIA